jgi:F-type H+-transporting ATPase subunit b
VHRQPYFPAAILILTSAFFCSPALAFDEAGGDTTREVASGHSGDDPHAKPELLDWDFGAALWTIGVFVILLVVLRITAWKPILAGLNQREEFIRKSLADARNEREQAERLLADYTAKLASAREQAGEIVEEGRRDGEETRRRIQAEAGAEAQAIVERAKRDIGLARDEAVRQLHEETIVLATTIAGKMIRRELSAADHQALLDESLAEMGRMNN